jgi:hypothetical protein
VPILRKNLHLLGALTSNGTQLPIFTLFELYKQLIVLILHRQIERQETAHFGDEISSFFCKKSKKNIEFELFFVFLQYKIALHYGKNQTTRRKGHRRIY